MTSVHNLSSATDSNVENASKVLAKEKGSDNFTEATADEVDKRKESDEQKQKEILEDKLRRSGGVFSKHMEALSFMDREVQAVLVKVVGAVSMDDVMAQRLTHVIQSIHLFRNGLSRVVTDHGSYNTQVKVKTLRNEILTQVYRSYTAEEEKVIFHKIFGQPKTSNKKVS